MIIREMKVQECWCGHCSAGQMEQIHEILFREKIGPAQLIDREITCVKCGNINKVDDFLSIIPTAYLVSAQSEVSKVKSNQELSNWLNAE
jgi:hypothetical protein